MGICLSTEATPTASTKVATPAAAPAPAPAPSPVMKSTPEPTPETTNVKVEDVKVETEDDGEESRAVARAKKMKEEIEKKGES